MTTMHFPEGTPQDPAAIERSRRTTQRRVQLGIMPERELIRLYGQRMRAAGRAPSTERMTRKDLVAVILLLEQRAEQQTEQG